MNADKLLVGRVSPEEGNQILKLFERKNGLYELMKIIDISNERLYDKLVEDMGRTTTQFQKWWDDMAIKYQWETVQNGTWEIDFRTFDIYLVFPK